MEKINVPNKKAILAEIFNKRDAWMLLITVGSPILGLPYDIAFARAHWWLNGKDPIVNQPQSSLEDWFSLAHFNAIRTYLGIPTKDK